MVGQRVLPITFREPLMLTRRSRVFVFFADGHGLVRVTAVSTQTAEDAEPDSWVKLPSGGYRPRMPGEAK